MNKTAKASMYQSSHADLFSDQKATDSIIANLNKQIEHYLRLIIEVLR